MNHLTKPIEKVFLESILKMSLISILAIIAVDIFFAGIVIQSIAINSSVLFAIVISYAFYHRGYFTTAVLLIGFLIMATMFYQSIVADAITTSSMAVVMIIGFAFSVLLKGKLPWFLHGIALVGMTVIFSWQALHPTRYSQPNASNIIVAGFTYQVLYALIAYTSKLLKQRYDEAIASVASINLELIEKSSEIEAQNEELVQSQENLYQLNNHLESIVQERTLEVQRQNEQLIKYAYSNAHHVRGPVARVLGLIQLAKMDTDLDYPFLFKKIEEQTNEIDEVVSRINKELERSDSGL